MNLNHFRLLRVVGRGAFGKVRIVERKDTGLSFALKYIRKDEGSPAQDWINHCSFATMLISVVVQSFVLRVYEILSASAACSSMSTTRLFATCDTASRI